MSRQRISKALTYLKARIPKSDPEITDDLIHEWSNATDHIGDDELRKMFQTAVVTFRSFPSVADFLDVLYFKTDVVYKQIMSELRRNGFSHDAYQKRIAENLGPLGWETVRLLEGWPNLCLIAKRHSDDFVRRVIERHVQLAKVSLIKKSHIKLPENEEKGEPIRIATPSEAKRAMEKINAIKKKKGTMVCP